MHISVMQDNAIALMIRHSWEATGTSHRTTLLNHTTLLKRRFPTRRSPVGRYLKTAVCVRRSAAADALPRIIGAACFELMRHGIVSTPGAEQPPPSAPPEQPRQQDGQHAVRQHRPP